MKSFLFFPVIAVALACSDQGVPQSTSISLVNNSTNKIICLAVAAAVANLIDIRDSLTVSSMSNHVVAIGESKEMEILGYSQGSGIRVFVYRLATPDAVKAGYKGFIDASGSELRQQRYRVQVSD